MSIKTQINNKAQLKNYKIPIFRWRGYIWGRNYRWCSKKEKEKRYRNERRNEKEKESMTTLNLWLKNNNTIARHLVNLFLFCTLQHEEKNDSLPFTYKGM